MRIVKKRPAFSAIPARRAPLAALLLLACGAASGAAPPAPARVVFSGMVDADFASSYGSFDQARHVTGLEADLATRIILNPTLYAVVRTTMRDGTVPRQGEGNTWAPLAFDGAQINWRPGDKTVFMAGDLVAGTGYFQYHRYKRAASVVGEHSLRGAGFRHGDLLVHAGVATDSIGGGGDLSVFGKWKRPIGKDISWTPSFRYTTGVPDATPFELGVTFEGSFEGMLDVQADVGMNYWNGETDPGSAFLIEARYSYEPWFFASTFFVSDKGEVPARNVPRATSTAMALDDLLLHFEPGMSLDKTFAVGLPLEYRNASFNSRRDESIWMIPTLYVYPAPRAQWWLWAGMSKPLLDGTDGNPKFSAGSEIVLTF
jgi:hypothetical protein